MNKSLLLLTEVKAAQLTAALANIGQADPLQVLCDEAAGEVQRLTTGYVIDANSQQKWTRELALERIYATANVPAPKQVAEDAKAAREELQAIAKGERPNLAKAAVSPAAPNAGSWGSTGRVTGRIPGSQ